MVFFVYGFAKITKIFRFFLLWINPIFARLGFHLESWSVAILSKYSVLKRFSQSPEPGVIAMVIEKVVSLLIKNLLSLDYGSLHLYGSYSTTIRK